MARTELEKGIQDRAAACARGRLRWLINQPKRESRGEIDDLIPDGNAAAPQFIAFAPSKNAKRQILDGKFGIRMVGRPNPAAQASVMGFIDFCMITHPTLCQLSWSMHWASNDILFVVALPGIVAGACALLINPRVGAVKPEASAVSHLQHSPQPASPIAAARFMRRCTRRR